MGANPTQATGIIVFFFAFVLLAAGLAAGGSLLLILGAIAVLAVSSGILMKCKPWEHKED